MADDSATERHMSKGEAITFLREQSQRIQEQRADIDVAEVLAEDPNAKAHAYIRALERRVEATDQDAKRAWAEVEKLDAEVTHHAGRLGTHREWLREAIRREKANAEIHASAGRHAYADAAMARVAAHESALRALDGDDEAGETDGGGSGE